MTRLYVIAGGLVDHPVRTAAMQDEPARVATNNPAGDTVESKGHSPARRSTALLEPNIDGVPVGRRSHRLATEPINSRSAGLT